MIVTTPHVAAVAQLMLVAYTNEEPPFFGSEEIEAPSTPRRWRAVVFL
jgi:hypothetical protein